MSNILPTVDLRASRNEYPGRSFFCGNIRRGMLDKVEPGCQGPRFQVVSEYHLKRENAARAILSGQFSGKRRNQRRRAKFACEYRSDTICTLMQENRANCRRNTPELSWSARYRPAQKHPLAGAQWPYFATLPPGCTLGSAWLIQHRCRATSSPYSFPARLGAFGDGATDCGYFLGAV